MRIRPDLSREEVAAVVCDALDQAGIEVVLSGGAVVSIYSENEYESFDLDFIRTGLARNVDRVMEALGFEKIGRHWKHAESEFFVEFPPGPVLVGELVVTEFSERRTPVGTLRILTPTDCVMDRLAGFYHWNDEQCVEQAVAVASRHPIDLDRIRDWSVRESSSQRFEEFLARLAATKVS
jgi:hypothetical protein